MPRYEDSPRDRSPLDRGRDGRRLQKSPSDRRRRDLSPMGGMSSRGGSMRDPYDEPYMRMKPEREPVPYKILCVTNLNIKVSDSSIREALMREFHRFGDVSIKVCHDSNERFAYIYFRSYEEARTARHAKSRMMLFDKSLDIDPIYESRSSYPSNSGGNNNNSSNNSRRPRSMSPDYGPPPRNDRGDRGDRGGGGGLRGHSPQSNRRAPMHQQQRGMDHGNMRGMDKGHHGQQGGGGGGGGGHHMYSSSSSSRSNSQQQHHMDNMHHPRDEMRNMRNDFGGGGRDGGRDGRDGGGRDGGGGGSGGGGSNSQHQHSSGHGNNGGGGGNGNNSSGGGGGSGNNRSRDSKKEKFPNYLHHVAPEEDEKATRTLFVGNLEVTISEPDLRRIFERYGVVEDIDVKRPPPGQGNAYAFIKFLNLDMAHRAKVEMSGQYIGKFQCKIGYGKATPTTRIWVGGLGPWTSLSHLEREFDRFGAIRKIDFVKGDNHAYIQYDSIDAAQAACQEMRGFPLGGPDKRLRVDFADPGPYSYNNGSPAGNEAAGGPAGGPTIVPPIAAATTRYRDGFVEGGPGAPRGREENGDFTPMTFDQTDVEPFCPANNPVDEHEMKQQQARVKKIGRRSLSPPCTGPLTAGFIIAATPSPRRSPRTVSEGGSGGRKQQQQQESGGGRSATSATRMSSSSGNNNNNNNNGVSTIPEGISLMGELVKCCSPAWSGNLMLKNSAFPARMCLLSGDLTLVEQLMRDGSADMAMLRITQRLRLDPPKLEDVTRRMSLGGNSNSCMLLCTTSGHQPVTAPGAGGGGSGGGGGGGVGEGDAAGGGVTNRPLRNLVAYLKQKEAAGVISLGGVGATSAGAGKEQTTNPNFTGVLYAFPPCPFALELVRKVAPNVSSDVSKEVDYLVVVVVRGIN